MTIALLYDPLFLEHDPGEHPENPGRLAAIAKGIHDSGWASRVLMPAARDASVDDLTLVHDRQHVESMRDLAVRGGGWVDSDTFVGQRSYDVAVRAAGAGLTALDLVMSGEASGAFCIPRPPGHHATPSRAMGFCIFNNVAIAAAKALQQGLERVAIIDIDVHHGNGTQDAFYEDGRVLYCSVHQYPHYPGTGHWREAGRGDGTGSTVNTPMPAGAGDEEYRQVWGSVFKPVLRRFQPQLILVSIGFDAHWADQLAGMQLSISGYAQLMGRIVELANDIGDGRVIFELEGGYDYGALASGVIAGLNVLSGEHEVEDPMGPAPHYRPIDISPIIDACRTLHNLA
jgi:acetoin utilization deacetylase AcuC-like enzyme